MTIDDLTYTFMQIVNYRAYLKGDFACKGLDLTTLTPKVATMCGDPNCWQMPQRLI